MIIKVNAIKKQNSIFRMKTGYRIIPGNKIMVLTCGESAKKFQRKK